VDHVGRESLTARPNNQHASEILKTHVCANPSLRIVLDAQGNSPKLTIMTIIQAC
jgi:hypothetical protein